MSLNRWAGLLGIVGAVLLVAGVLMVADTPDGDAPDQEWVANITDNESLLLARAYIFIVAGLCIVGLYALGVRERLGNADATDRALSGLGAGSSALGAASLATAGLIGAAVGAAHKFGDVPIDPNIARLFDNLVYGFLLVGAAVPFAVTMAVVAIQTRRRDAFPQWILWVSLLGILGMAVSLIFLPFVLLPVWLVCLSVVLLRSPAASTA